MTMDDYQLINEGITLSPDNQSRQKYPTRSQAAETSDLYIFLTS